RRAERAPRPGGDRRSLRGHRHDALLRPADVYLAAAASAGGGNSSGRRSGLARERRRAGAMSEGARRRGGEGRHPIGVPASGAGARGGALWAHLPGGGGGGGGRRGEGRRWRFGTAGIVVITAAGLIILGAVPRLRQRAILAHDAARTR